MGNLLNAFSSPSAPTPYGRSIVYVSLDPLYPYELEGDVSRAVTRGASHPLKPGARLSDASLPELIKKHREKKQWYSTTCL